MKFETYKQLVNTLPFGKRLPDAVYLHQSYLEAVPAALGDFISQIESEHGEDFEWNVLKLHRRDHKVTLLSYPEFDDESYPPLRSSLTIDLVRNRVRKTSFAESDNPPILHRKETLVPQDYPLVEHFAALTDEGEQAGLYENSKRIGFQKSWERLIAQAGYALVDGRIVRNENVASKATQSDDADVVIHRHLTAVDRDKLSTPMQSLARHGFLDGGYSILDYGCGKGHDLLELEAHGLDAVGWDPAYRPDGKKRPSDIVNLGFVINVIEDRDERAEALRDAYSLAKRFLAVAVMLGGDSTTSKFQPYKDGVVTSRGTFQKYYTQSSLRDFLETTLNAKAVAVGPGLFYVFADDLLEQEFLVRRQTVKREWTHLAQRDRAAPAVDHQALIEKNLDLFKDFWITCLDMGRSPANDEFERSVEIRRVIGSHRKALDACKEYFGEGEYESAEMARRKDLTVFLALSFFDRHRAYARMPLGLQRDIRSFFGKPSEAYDFAKQALFTIADAAMIELACRNAHEKLGCGRLEDSGSLTILTNLIAELPPLLRIYVGCALQLYGDVEDVDLVKIHVGSGKVTLLAYDDFSKPLPLLKERIKIRMKDQEVDFFPASPAFEQQPLYLKSQFMKHMDPSMDRQRAVDEIQLKTGLDFSDHGPRYSEFQDCLDKQGLSIPERL